MKRIALLGMPNTGKSTLFNRISGASARVGNWPGITVDLMSAKILIGGHIAELIDLPGIYDIHGFSEDEQVVRHFLSNNAVDLVIVLLNSSQIDRQLSLVLQIKKLKIPAVLALNMADEARQSGITIDADNLAKALEMPVLQISAKYGDGLPKALQAATQIINQNQPATDPQVIAQFLQEDNQIEHEMEDLIQHHVQMPTTFTDNTTDKIDRVLLHKWFGLPIFFAAMFVLFQFIFTVGKPLQDGLAWALSVLRSGLLEPIFASSPAWLSGLMLDGIYNGVATVAAFVPIIVLFFLVMSMVEDSGYLSRAAFLMDALMAKMGLDGRGFVMMLMGFGCNVPALMGTRIMRSRPMRLLTMLVIPLSLCSARLQVFIFMITALFAANHAPLVLFSLYVMSFLTMFLTAVLFQGQYKNAEPFILELPPYRFPTLRQIILRGWHEVKHFLVRASKFIVIGVVLVWALTNFPSNVPPASAGTYAGQIGALFAPFLDPIGINSQLAIALIFGFVAKEIVVGALAVIYGMQGDALMSQIAMQIDWVQAMSFMLFTLIYTPCLSTIATIRSESKSSGFMWLSIAWSLGLAWVVSFMFYQGARWLGY
ncbi:MAG: ferrous iron transport protein B [Methylotenera sp.]|uniref:ferrous iron transport protein B n=1 Tax=Methylotenera sp. TaxID=2051956 RepID=UPI0027320454|nr:ferrous iron transport protein B [Methylotenera sp.]MDP1522278.1 ferrous iron transport protein B [Methylotenera sp.]MDZ4211686.1 ferrous iron transport protein B [Methylotenera sp.]